jgi:DNA invertase Pin-like site-specific DNA recombinase
MLAAKYADYLGQPQTALAVWRAALYIRLSKEDGDKAESYSITSQREILKEYLKLHPDIKLYDLYIDDGWSGTSFNRPGFMRMMEDVYSGAVNCVIVKDLSRFGRNYTDCGHYLDDVFVRLRIRFIALNNGVDTASNNMNAATQCISVGVTNVINESVAATTSVNVRGTLNVNRQQGKFIGSFPTYGYLKDPNDHHKLIIDEETAPIVRQIFEKFIGGESIIGIAKDLNEMGIPNPSMYKRLKGMNYKHPAGASLDGLWPDSSVRRILVNEMYIGNMIQGKNTTISYKIKQCRAIPKENWIKVEGTHEPIIDKDTFEKAQSLFNRNIRTAPEKREIDLFSGFVRCADCGRAMCKKTNVHPYGTYHYYRCSTARKMRKSACSNHTIRIDKLYEAVLVTIQKMIDAAVKLDEVLDKINASKKRKTESPHIQNTLKTTQAQREKCMKMLIDLYPDWKNGDITKEEYLLLKQNITEQIDTLDSMITSLNSTKAEYEKGVNDENEFIAHFKKYGKIKELTRPLLIELVDKILVHEDGGITIQFKFADAYENVLEYVEINRETSEPA